MSAKQLLFGHRTVTTLGCLMLAGISVRLCAWTRDDADLARVGIWLTVPFLAMLGLLVLVVLPYTWLTSQRR